MKTIFKKTLVAAALVSAGFAVQAADVTTNVVNVSAQGSIGTPTIGSGVIEVELEAAYSVGDTIRITFTGGTLTASPLTITSDGVGNPVTLGRIASDATSVTYRVTEISGAGADHGSFVFAANDFTFNSASVISAGTVGFTYAAFIGSTTQPLDTPVEYNADEDLTSGAVFNVRNQFVASVAPAGRLSKTLDVTEDREEFTDGTTVDTLAITYVNRSTDVGAVAQGNTRFTVKGDFSWADSAAVGTPACTGGALVGAAAVTSSTYVFTCDAATTAASVVFDIDQGADTVPVSPTSFALDVDHIYNAGNNTLSQTNLNAGAWGVNGSNITIPYMVYGTLGGKSFSQVISHANTGGQAGTIFADVWIQKPDGTTSKLLNNYELAQSPAASLQNLAGPLRTAINSANGATFNGRAIIRLLTDVEVDNVQVYSAYVDNVTTERAVVPNDSPVVSKE